MLPPCKRLSQTLGRIGLCALLFLPAACMSSGKDNSSFPVSLRAMSKIGVSSPRAGHTAVWTGEGMLVYGGMLPSAMDDRKYVDLAIYYPRTRKWMRLPSSGQQPRHYHATTWYDGQLFIHGGEDAFGDIHGDSLLYDVESQAWQTIPGPEGVKPRKGHTGTKAGNSIVIFGGETSDDFSAELAVFDPKTMAWSPVAHVDVDGRAYHTAVWTGEVLLVWGGMNEEGALGNGAAYNPETETWSEISTANAPAARHGHSAVWTGTHMIVWGGVNDGEYYGDGGVYDPATNSWKPLNSQLAPDPRQLHTAVWADGHMIVFGGIGSAETFADGGAYDPTTDRWRPLQPKKKVPSRFLHSAVWTGKRMLIYGGRSADGAFIEEDDLGYVVRLGKRAKR